MGLCLACRYFKIYTQCIRHAPEEQKHLRQGGNIQMIPKYPNRNPVIGFH